MLNLVADCCKLLKFNQSETGRGTGSFFYCSFGDKNNQLSTCSKVNIILTILKSILIRYCFIAIICFILYSNHYDQFKSRTQTCALQSQCAYSCLGGFMLFGHWFPPHDTSLAGCNSDIVTVGYSFWYFVFFE